jgi:hypothetical protein
MNNRPTSTRIIKVTFGTLGLLAVASPVARAQQARWGGGFGGGETRTIAASTGQTRWAAGWGGQQPGQKIAAPPASEPAPRTIWAAGWGGEPDRTVKNTDLAARSAAAQHRHKR